MKTVRWISSLLVGILLAAGAFTPAYADTPRPLVGAATYDAASLVDAAGASTTVTVVGAALGDFCIASLGVSTAGITVTCNVTAANTATVRFQNETAGTLDLASATLRVMVFPKPAGS